MGPLACLMRSRGHAVQGSDRAFDQGKKEEVAGGFFVAGPAEGPAVAEACESAGTLVGYRPEIGLVHNISRDHDEVPGLRHQFSAFAKNCTRLFVNEECPEAVALGRQFKVTTYGTPPSADARLRVT